MSAPSRLLDDLRAAVGPAHVLTEGDLSAWELDWRKRARGRALAVVRPADRDQVAAVVRACAAHRTAIVPQGGNTGLVGGGVPDASGTQVLLSLARCKRVRAVDADNLTLTAEAGCVLADAQRAAAEHGLLLALSLAAEGSCTIGGNLATNAGGTQVVRYGTARAQCLGLEVVTPQGEVWQELAGLRKDNTGYDLRDLYIGSEGTLGIITAATLRLHPAPAAQCTALVACKTLQDCVALLRTAQARLGPGLTGFEVMNAAALALVARHFPALPRPLAPCAWTVLIEHADAEDEAHAHGLVERALQAATASGCAADAVIATSLAQARQLWQLREHIPLAQAQEGSNVKHDIALPISRVPAFVAATDARLAQAFPGVRLIDYGHLGDGNLHYNVQAPQGVADEDFLREHEAAINALVYDAVLAHGGSISAEHGIGSAKREALARAKAPAALAAMRAIKAALDPQGIMNPGRVL